MTRRLILFGLMACAMFGLGAPDARAGVHVDFLFGGHGHYHHHYHPRYHYWADYYWYAPPPPVRYVPVAAPAPVVYVPTAVSAAAPATAAPSLAPTIQSSSQPAQPNLRANALPVQSTTREASATVTASVVVSNPADSGGQVSFILDGKQEMTLAPGEKTTLTDGVGRAVEFDRGGSFGTTRVTLGEGSYEFAVTQSGWDLQRRSPTTVSGSTNPTVRRNELPVQR